MRSPLRIAILSILAVALIGAAAIAWHLRERRAEFLTDAGSIRLPVDAVTPRDVLWHPPERLAAPLNSTLGELEPRVTDDGFTLLLVRGRPGRNTDLLESTRTVEGWSEPQPIAALNSRADDLGPEPAADGTVLYFASNRVGGHGGYDLWLSRRGPDGWGAPVNLGPAVNTAADEYAPALAPDGTLLVFASNRSAPGATVDPHFDLYAAPLGADGPAPAAPLTGVNTRDDETAPAFTPSGDFLYFASNRTGGRGGFDLYRARWVDGRLLPAENVGAPVNTAANELDPAPDMGGFGLYFTSDRRAEGTTPTDERDYDLHHAVSREVFATVETYRASIDGELLLAVGTWIGLAILLVLLLWLFLWLLSAHRFRRLTLIMRCLLASLAAHALILVLFAFWGVTAALSDRDSTGRGVRVALVSPVLGSELESQVRGSLTDVTVDAEQVESERADESTLALLPLSVTATIAVERAPIVSAPDAAPAEMREAPAPSDEPVPLAPTAAEEAPPVPVDTPDVPAPAAAAERLVTAAPAPATPAERRTDTPTPSSDAAASVALAPDASPVERTASEALVRVEDSAPAASPSAPAPVAVPDTNRATVAVADLPAARAARTSEARETITAAAASPSAAPVAQRSSDRLDSAVAVAPAPTDARDPGRLAPDAVASATDTTPRIDAAPRTLVRLVPDAPETTLDVPAAARRDGTTEATRPRATAAPVTLAGPAATPPSPRAAVTGPRATVAPDRTVDAPVGTVVTFNGTESAPPSSAAPSASPTTLAAQDRPSLDVTLPAGADAPEPDADAPRVAVAASATATGRAAVASARRPRAAAGNAVIAPTATADAPRDRGPRADVPSSASAPPVPAAPPSSALAALPPALQLDAALPTGALPTNAVAATNAAPAPSAVAAGAFRRAASAPPPTAHRRMVQAAPERTGAPVGRSAASAGATAALAPTRGGLPLPAARPTAIAAAFDPLDLDLPLPRAVTTEENPFRQRDPEVRQKLVQEMGGSAATEAAVERSLEWLARHQARNGRWDSRGFDDSCNECAGPASVNVDIAATGLSLLCYLAAGHTHTEDGPFRETVDRGLRWLVAQQRTSGALVGGESMYSHGIATIALTEAYGMTGDPELEDSVRRAAKFIVFARNQRTGGWRYAPQQSGDTSVTGWQIMALTSAKKVGIDVGPEGFSNARMWMRRVSTVTAPGLYAYQPDREVTPAMTAEGMFIQQLLGTPDDEASYDASASYVTEHLPDWDDEPNTYFWYYATLALFQHQGEAWDQWNERIKTELLEAQITDGLAAGSWDPNDRWARVGGRVYQTAICTLTLQVYYRYLPLYVRNPE